MGAEISQKLREKFSKLPNYADGHFRNTHPIKLNFNGRSFTPALLKHVFAPPDRPKTPIPQVALSEKDFGEVPDEFSVRWLGHSTLIYELAGMRIITDPIFGNAAPIPFAVPRYCKSPLARKHLPKLDLVLLTHDHYDHLELATIEMLMKRKDLKFVTMLGVGEHLRKWGVPDERITELYWGDSTKIGPLTIRAAEARHFSGRSFGKRDTTLWGAFILEFETPTPDGTGTMQRKIFHGGDGGYGDHFKKIGEAEGSFDLVCLEIDAWNKNWHGHHMFPQEAVEVLRELNGRVILPIHWGVFDLAMHPWNESVEILANEAKAHKVQGAFPKMGELVSFLDPNGPLPQERWWQ